MAIKTMISFLIAWLEFSISKKSLKLSVVYPGNRTDTIDCWESHLIFATTSIRCYIINTTIMY